jgi:hypothetical protein
MLGYSYTNVFAQCEIALYNRAVKLVERIPETVHDKPLRCHEVTRAVATVLKLPYTDGKFGSVEHSWCWTSTALDGEYPGNILDVYCVGRLPMVQLIGYGIPGVEFISSRSLYSCYPFPRKDIRSTVVDTILYLIGKES